MSANHFLEQLMARVREIWEGEKSTPLKVSVMGQTGVGKSSLINALFKADLDTNPVRPSTTETQEHLVKGTAGRDLLFYDLPGIGESQKSDEGYLLQYRQKLQESDIAIWAIHADSRSFTFDSDALNNILETLDSKLQVQLMSKIIFVLTKADLLMPSPWILSRLGDEGVFAPHGATEVLLEQKEIYFQEAFLLPFKHLITAQTYFSGTFGITIPGLRYDKDRHTVYYDGFLDREGLARFKRMFSRYAEVLERLHDNYRAIPCSSRFRFNLDLLMRVIIDKLATQAIGRFSSFHTETRMDRVPFSEAKRYHNLVVLDEARRRVFDLSTMEF